MKTVITFVRGFSIPKELPHAFDFSGSPIFCDTVKVVAGKLILTSICGMTTFHSWSETEDAYIIPAGATASYTGAYGALNAVTGIDFPPCEYGEIKSSYGRFQTKAGYELARRALVFARYADLNGHAEVASREMDAIADRLGNRTISAQEDGGVAE
jgi:hypothetical protein